MCELRVKRLLSRRNYVVVSKKSLSGPYTVYICRAWNYTLINARATPTLTTLRRYVYPASTSRFSVHDFSYAFFFRTEDKIYFRLLSNLLFILISRFLHGVTLINIRRMCVEKRITRFHLSPISWNSSKFIHVKFHFGRWLHRSKRYNKHVVIMERTKNNDNNNYIIFACFIVFVRYRRLRCHQSSCEISKVRRQWVQARREAHSTTTLGPILLSSLPLLSLPLSLSFSLSARR